MSHRQPKNKSTTDSMQQSQASLYQPVDKIDLRAESPRDRRNNSQSGDRRRESSRNRDSDKKRKEGKLRSTDSSKDIASLRIVNDVQVVSTSQIITKKEMMKMKQTHEVAQQKRSESRGVIKVKVE